MAGKKKQAMSQGSLNLNDRNNLPSLFRQADRGASRSKWLYFFLVGGELVCICIAAVVKVFGQALAPAVISVAHIRIQQIPFQGGNASPKDVTDALAGLAAPTLFLVIGGAFYVVRLIMRYDEFWRARRAIAEAMRELAWRYGMRAMAADLRASVPLDADASKAAFEAEFNARAKEAAQWQLGTPKGQEITEAMKRLREQGGMEQREIYLRDRVREAETWYSVRATRYFIAMWIFQGARIGAYIAGGFLIFFDVFGSNGLSVMTTIAGALGIWLVAQHYDDLRQSYEAISAKLNLLHDTAPSAPPGSPSGAGIPGNAWVRRVDRIETLLKGERQDWLRESKSDASAD